MNRGTSRKAVLYRKDGGIKVFASLKALNRHLGRNPSYIQGRPGYRSGRVVLDDGEVIILAKAAPCAMQLSEEEGEYILEVAKRMAQSIRDPIEEVEEIRERILCRMLDLLRKADPGRFRDVRHAIHVAARYAKLTYLRERRFQDPLLHRPEEEEERRLLDRTPTPYAETADDLAELYLPEDLRPLARLQIAGLPKREIRRRLGITRQEYDEKLRRIDSILKGED